MARRKLTDAEIWQAIGMVRGGMSYIQTAERFNESHSVIVRLTQRLINVLPVLHVQILI
jgi:transposase